MAYDFQTVQLWLWLPWTGRFYNPHIHRDYDHMINRHRLPNLNLSITVFDRLVFGFVWFVGIGLISLKAVYVFEY